jgi:hypothetical protein
MDTQALLLGKLLNWADKRRGAFTYWDIERECSWPRELAVALVKQALETGAIQPVSLGYWRRIRQK